jgi:hypothetical protein
MQMRCQMRLIWEKFSSDKKRGKENNVEREEEKGKEEEEQESRFK